MESILAGLFRVPLLGRGCERFFSGLFRRVAAAMWRARRHSVRPREWSNSELKKFAGYFDGAVINVSGWRDEDKRGGRYREYFSRAAGYAVSNFSGAKGMADAPQTDHFIDLESMLPEEMRGQFQVVFNHTTLEHVFDIHRAIENLCALSSDAVILVTPFLQSVHFEEGSFGDYWRPTPMCLERLLEAQGFTTIYQSANDTPWHYVYVFTVALREASRHPDLPRGKTGLVGAGHFAV